jgi:hypothetical protein
MHGGHSVNTKVVMCHLDTNKTMTKLDSQPPAYRSKAMKKQLFYLEINSLKCIKLTQKK